MSCKTTPATTAVLFIEFQNEFCTEGGKLHPAVADNMKQTNMLENAAKVAEKVNSSDQPKQSSVSVFRPGRLELLLSTPRSVSQQTVPTTRTRAWGSWRAAGRTGCSCRTAGGQRSAPLCSRGPGTQCWPANTVGLNLSICLFETVTEIETQRETDPCIELQCAPLYCSN